MQLVLEQHRRDILRGLRARGCRLLPGQIIEIVPGGDGVSIMVKVTTAAAQALRVGEMLARDFFTETQFKQVIGWNTVVKETLERLHRIVNGQGKTVKDLLDDPDFTAAKLLARHRWEAVHIAELKRFHQTYYLVLRS